MRSVELSGVSGIDSPGSPQRQRSQQCVSCADVHYRVLVQWTLLFTIASESPQHDAYSIFCLIKVENILFSFVQLVELVVQFE